MTDEGKVAKKLALYPPKRLMDELEIVSEVGKGTIVTMKKWAR